jgi:hypothetical protein
VGTDDDRPDPPPQVRIGIRFLTVDPGSEGVLGRLIFQQMSAEARRRRHLRGMRRLKGEPSERRDAYRVELPDGGSGRALLRTLPTGGLPPRSWSGRVCNLSLSGCAICVELDPSAMTPPAPSSALEIELPGLGVELRGVVVYLLEDRL